MANGFKITAYQPQALFMEKLSEVFSTAVPL
jgi:hypothetical protein